MFLFSFLVYSKLFWKSIDVKFLLKYSSYLFFSISDEKTTVLYFVFKKLPSIEEKIKKIEEKLYNLQS